MCFMTCPTDSVTFMALLSPILLFIGSLWWFFLTRRVMDGHLGDLATVFCPRRKCLRFVYFCFRPP